MLLGFRRVDGSRCRCRLGSTDAKEGLESGHFHAEDILLELLLKESCVAELEGKSLTF